jgi:3-hydroxypropanoate dehydrogenase
MAEAVAPEVTAARAAIVALRRRIAKADDTALDLVFREARTHNAWTNRPVTDEDLKRLFDTMKFGPTSTNCNPARFVFLRTDAAKAKLVSALNPANVPKVQAAPVTCIVAHDVAFFEHLPRLFPHRDVAPRFRSNPQDAEVTAFRNSTLQGAYMMLAARAIGLDVGAMSGFDNAKADSIFFAGTTLRSNFLINLGYGDENGLFQRLPRFAFDEVCRIE